MAKKIEWRDFEERSRRARFTVTFPSMQQGRRQFLMPVYLFWSEPPKARSSRHGWRLAAVFAAVLAVGAGLGIGLAAVLLP